MWDDLMKDGRITSEAPEIQCPLKPQVADGKEVSLTHDFQCVGRPISTAVYPSDRVLSFSPAKKTRSNKLITPTVAQ
jgi:hypothetical protein